MHPGLAAGVEQHSVFFDDPLARLERSVWPIPSVVYAGETAPAWGRLIRSWHTSIRGVDKYGRRYSALNPDTFYWAHTTFLEHVITGREKLGFPMSETEKLEFYLDSIDWYRLYGVSMRPAPTDGDAFQEYWEHMVTHVLEDSRPVREGFRMHRTAPLPALTIGGPPALRAALSRWPVKPLVQSPALHLMEWLTIGGLPDVLKERLCLDWTWHDELRYRAHLRAMHELFSAPPDDAQFLPIARRAIQHHGSAGNVAPIPLPGPVG
jgi:uncharacterized protein (DUF2236 family)